MALSLKRFAAIFAVFAAAMLAGWVGLQATIYENQNGWQFSAPPPRRDADRLDAAVALLARRDSVATALRRQPPAPGLTVVMPNIATPVERRIIDSTAQAFWRSAGAGRSFPTVVLFTNDGSRLSSGDLATELRFNTVLVPNESLDNACVMMFTSRVTGQFGQARVDSLLGIRLRRYLEANAGPCLLYSRYGRPGRSVAAWLASERWSPATAVARPDTSNLEPYSPRVARTARSRAPAIVAMNEYFTGAASPRWSPNMGTIACLAGQDAMCAAAVHHASARSNASPVPLLPSSILYVSRINTRVPWDRSLLAHVEEEAGPEKFGAFWRSSGSVDDALRTAVGREPARFVRDALERDYLALHGSPWPTILEWLVQGAILAATIGLMSYGARRRAISV